MGFCHDKIKISLYIKDKTGVTFLPEYIDIWKKIAGEAERRGD